MSAARGGWRAALLAVIAATGCAGASSGVRRLANQAPPGVARAWLDLEGGLTSRAVDQLRHARASDEPLAAFGVASVAYERGDAEAALDGFLRVLELSRAQPSAWTPLLSAAAATRVATLVEEVPDRTAAEQRVLALPWDGMPWQGRLVLARAADEAMRRRGDPAELAKAAQRAGCPSRVTLVGRVAALPSLDLEAAGQLPRGTPRPLETTGCRVVIPPREGRQGLPGVIELNLDVHVPGWRGREHDVVVEHDGLAALRVDEGPWLRHASADAYGPSASAHRVRLSPGDHRVTLRIGLYGYTAELTVLLAPAAVAAPEDDLPRPDALPAGLALAYELARATVAGSIGEADTSALLQARLARRRSAGVALAQAAALAVDDPARPGHMNREAARTLYLSAIQADRALGRSHRELGLLELADERPREAIEHAAAAVAAAPRWWPAHALLQDALEAQGLELEADRVLDRALTALGGDGRACGLLSRAMARAARRRDERGERRLAQAASRCDARSEALAARLRLEGDTRGAAAALGRSLAVATSRDWLRLDLGGVLLAAGDAQAAVTALRGATSENPRDASLWIRLADAQGAAGDVAGAKQTLQQTLARFPGRMEARQAARAAHLPLPLDALRIDGRGVIRGFEARARPYDAPAVLVLDRTVERVLPDGGRLVLTHNIVKVQSKDAIDRWGEVSVPAGADVLALRTIKADGRLREPEDIVGKDSISAPDLQAGDYVEWELIEYEDPTPAFAPGFLGNRFFFRSFELPLDRSEYVVITPRDLRLDVDARGGAPVPQVEQGPESTVIHTFQTASSPQVFAERAAVPPLDWLPSVRVSSGVSFAAWSRFVADRLAPLVRTTPELDALAARLAREAGRDETARATAVVRWVTEHIEAEAGLDEPASYALARGRGNRLPLALVLLRGVGVQAVPILARPRTTADLDAPLAPQELDGFSELLIWLPLLDGADRFVDVRLRHAPFGYVAPAVDGSRAVVVGSNRTVVPRTSTTDERRVAMTAQVAADGRGQVAVEERLRGWPALEWAEILDRVGRDHRKLSQEFEERWLAQHFPGAQLTDVSIELVDGGQGGVALHYRFSTAQMGARSGTTLIISPGFFRAQPGRRYATEAVRQTTLLMGYDVPLELSATFRLPPGTRVLDVGRSDAIDIGGPRGGRFAETRSGVAVARGGVEVRLRRSWRLPLVRVDPRHYADVAAQLRRVDPLELGSIRADVGSTVPRTRR